MLVSPGGGDAVMRQGLEIPTHDYIANTYSGTNLTVAVFRRGGASGTVVATLTMTYDGNNNVTSITKS